MVEEAAVKVRGSLARWFAKEEDMLVVQAMDKGNVECISRVLAQSVALAYYNAKVCWPCFFVCLLVCLFYLLCLFVPGVRLTAVFHGILPLPPPQPLLLTPPLTQNRVNVAVAPPLSLLLHPAHYCPCMQ